VIHLATRKIAIVGATPNPNGAFMMQIARNLTDEFDGFLRNHRYLIMDRDRRLTEVFRDALERASSAYAVRHGRRSAMRTQSALSAPRRANVSNA
jgi:hypothetical protein